MSVLARLTSFGLLLALLLSPEVGHAHHVRSGLRRYAVILVLDGNRPDDFNFAAMPNLHWLMRHGTTYRNAFVGQQLAITPTSHATIGSGVFPKHHGVMGFWWKDPRTGAMTRPTDTGPIEAGALERVMVEAGAPSLARNVKSVDPHAGVLSASGHKCYASDAMGTAWADVILCSLIYHDRWVAQAVRPHLPPPGAINNPHWDVPIPPPNSGLGAAVQQWRVGAENRWTIDYALWTARHMHFPHLMMINLPETDVLGHFAPGNRWVFHRLMVGFDQELGQIMRAYRRAGIFSRTDFLVTADHGMDTIQQRLPFHALDQSMTMAGATKVVEEADTGAFLAIKQPWLAPAVARNVARLDFPYIDASYYKVHRHGRWSFVPAYLRPGLPYYLRRAYLTLADTSASAAGPEVMVDYAPHITTGDRIAHGYHWLGGHLGPDWDEQHIPLILSGPGIRQGVVSDYPARLVDIAPTIERLLHVPSGRVDGHVLADALLHPTRAQRKTQAGLRAQLLPLVHALQARSAHP